MKMDLCNSLNIKQNQLINIRYALNDYSKKRSEKLVLSSGSKNCDEIFGGGLYTGKKYLIFGANKTGKTQICHQICVQAYKNFSRIYEKLKNVRFVYYFDTENTFRPERIRDIANEFKYDYKKVLKSILVTKILSNSAFLLTLNDLENLIEKKPYGVLIIDTLNNHFRSEQGEKRISYKKSKDTFIEIIKKINSLTKTYNLITIATAQVAPNLFENAFIRVLPAGNHFINNYFSEYLYLNRKEEGKYYIHNVNSSANPEKRLLYKITSSGIQDYKI